MLAAEEQIVLEAVAKAAGRPLNPNSGDQVAALLYDELRLHQKAPNIRVKLTKSRERYSTNDKTLEALAPLHPLVGLIQEAREIRKLRSVYVDPMPRLVRADGRLHPRFRITRTDTGRLSAADPNVLAFPKHSARGKLIRKGIVAGAGRELASFDLKQIEMVVFACDSGDEAMIAEILSGVDKHAATAERVYHRPAADIMREHEADLEPGTTQRFSAKAVNFGTLMGITEFGLTDQMHKNKVADWTVERSVETLEAWRDAYPQGWAYIRAKHAEGRRYGFVRDMWGRLRWLEGIRSSDDYIRAEAERMAQATPVQSGAQGIMKRNMAAAWPRLRALRQRGVWVEPLLQIHDDLVLEYDVAARDEVGEIVMDAMQNTVELAVPIQASRKTGQTWGDL
jgi:DNA polymerase-1